MEELKKLQEKRAEVIGKMETLQTEVRAAGVAMTEEQRTAWNSLNDLLADIDAKIEIEDRMTKVAVSKVVKDGVKTEVEKQEERKRLVDFLLTGEVRANLDVMSGQYIIPSSIFGVIEKALKSFGGVMSVANIFVTSTGAPLNFPTVNDTDAVADIIGEGEEVAVDKKNVIGNVTLKAFTYATKAYPISKELIQDSAFDIEALIVELLTDSFKRGFNKHLTSGNGIAQPQGVATAATKGVDAAVDGITYQNLIDLMFSVDAGYQTGAHWMFNSKTLAKIMTLTDPAGQYIYQPSLRDAVPGVILNKPYVINEDMDGIGADKKSVLFGDFKKYKVRVVRDFECSRLVEVFALQRCIGFLGFARMDAKLIDAGTHPIKALVHASA